MTVLSCSGAGFDAARTLARVRHGHGFFAQAISPQPLEMLAGELAAACASLTLCDLDPLFASPDDLTLARHLASCLSAPAELALRSAPDLGVRRLAGGDEHVWFDTRFEAAHQLPNVPAGHPCGRLHGHGFGVRIEADAARATHASLAAAWQPLAARLEHRLLNEIAGLANPTSEVLAAWLFAELDVDGLVAVEVYETASAGSRFDGGRWTIWKTLRFEAARAFDAAGRYTGHSYRLRLRLAGDALDAELGWLRDFGDVKRAFAPLYDALDHHLLDTLPGLAATDCASLASYIGERFAMPALAGVDVLQNGHDGALWRKEAACTR